MNFLIVIGGPTAAGKTSLAIRIAKEFGTNVLSADSRQFYREMSIGTAKPTAEEQQAVPHYFIDSSSIESPYDIGRFEQEALVRLSELFYTNNIQVMVGGSGLYLEAVVRGLDELPGRDPAIREELEKKLQVNGLFALQEELRQLDPEAAAAIDLQNPHRLIRAIELCRTTGAPLSAVRSGKKNNREFTPILIAVSPEREELYRRIDQRVTTMMEAGLLEEVQGLFEKRHLSALKTVGYSELFEHLEGKISREEAIRQIQQHTRNYAKRQLTWFRNRGTYQWFHPEQTDDVLAFIRTLTGDRQ